MESMNKRDLFSEAVEAAEKAKATEPLKSKIVRYAGWGFFILLALGLLIWPAMMGFSK
jgi:hypothetical protein